MERFEDIPKSHSNWDKRKTIKILGKSNHEPKHVCPSRKQHQNAKEEWRVMEWEMTNVLGSHLEILLPPQFQQFSLKKQLNYEQMQCCHFSIQKIDSFRCCQ